MSALVEGNDWDWEASEENEQAAAMAGAVLDVADGVNVHASADIALAALRNSHNLDLAALCNTNNLDMYARIRLVNYSRKQFAQLPAADAVADICGKVGSLGSAIYFSDELLVPIVEGDPLLQHIIAIDDGDAWSSDDDAGTAGDGGSISENTDSASTAVAEQKSEIRSIANSSEPGGDNAARVALLQRQLAKAQMLLQSYAQADSSDAGVENVAPDNDTYYFDSYSHWGIHEEMLKDFVRTEAYRQAIENNRAAFEGKVVLDVGCGTGILSMFAARAGARRVVGVDMSEMSHKARKIVKENGLDHIITIVHGKVEDLEEHRDAMFADGFDVIISEWMGYALVYECMLETVLCARDAWLRPGGLVLPNIAKIYVNAVADLEEWNSHVGYWKDVYGFKMSCMEKPYVREAHVTIVPKKGIASDRQLVQEMDVISISPVDLDLRQARFELHVTDSGVATKADDSEPAVTGICISFDCLFAHGSLETSVVLPTGPLETPTHWKQTLLYLPEPVPISTLPSGLLAGTISISRNAINPRELDLELTLDVLQNDILAYHMR